MNVMAITRWSKKRDEEFSKLVTQLHNPTDLIDALKKDMRYKDIAFINKTRPQVQIQSLIVLKKISKSPRLPMKD